MYLTKEEVYENYELANTDAKEWKKDYPEFERLMNNGLLEDLDESLPAVNDGTLAASLYKAAKRIIPRELEGRAKALDDADQWITELANIVRETRILPNAKSQGSPRRKWKDAVRKSMGFGGVPIFSFFGQRGNYTGADFVVLHPYDVKLEAGKVSDLDSDIVFMDVYYTKLQVKRLIEEAKKENKEAKEEGRDSYNKWDIKNLEAVLQEGEVDKDSDETPRDINDRAVKKNGYKFCIAFQRGVDAPFYMFKGKKNVREWTNPNPTGDIPIHYLYAYQDFVNPYGIGIVQLAGGTQNVLDYMRQADVKATQIGISAPVSVSGDTSKTDLNSIVYESDAVWLLGDATVRREEMSSGIYNQLPSRIGMYKISLDQMLPTGDTSISAAAGDTEYSKTPAGVKARQAELSVDDEDFTENFYETYEAVNKSMINIHFANMQGSDLMDLSPEQREILEKAGIPFPIDENDNLVGQLEVEWDNARANFDFEMDTEASKMKDEDRQLEGSLKIYEMTMQDPNAETYMQAAGKKFNRGELLADIIGRLTDNDKIVTDISPEDQEQIDSQQMQAEQMAQQQMMGQPSEQQQMPQEQMQPQQPMQQPAQPEMNPEQMQANLQAVMQQYGVPEEIAAQMLDAEAAGVPPQQIQQLFKELSNA